MLSKPVTWWSLSLVTAVVLVALVARFGFHEAISPMRWLGIALITAGVGFVAAGPSLTTHSHSKQADPISQEVSS